MPPLEHPSAADTPEEVREPDDKQQEPSEDAPSDADTAEPEPPA